MDIKLVERVGIEPTARTMQESVAPLEHASPYYSSLCSRHTTNAPLRNRTVLPRLGYAKGIEPHFLRCWPASRIVQTWCNLNCFILVDPRRVELRLSVCKTDVLPLSLWTLMFKFWWSYGESNPKFNNAIVA